LVAPGAVVGAWVGAGVIVGAAGVTQAADEASMVITTHAATIFHNLLFMASFLLGWFLAVLRLL